jgi:hypothetical protein
MRRGCSRAARRIRIPRRPAGTEGKWHEHRGAFLRQISRLILTVCCLRQHTVWDELQTDHYPDGYRIELIETA